MNFYLADTHWGHKNCMAFDNRPFSSVEESDQVLISNWNDAVNIDDDVYILGDLSWYNVTKTTDIIKGLNGNKHLLVGNHDGRFLKNKDFRDCFVEITYYKELDLGDGKKLILSHYPMPFFNGQFRGNWHFYGHVHNSQQWNMIENLKRIQEEERGAGTCDMINVGVMMEYMKYTPRTFNEVIDGYEKYRNKMIMMQGD